MAPLPCACFPCHHCEALPVRNYLKADTTAFGSGQSSLLSAIQVSNTHVLHDLPNTGLSLVLFVSLTTSPTRIVLPLSPKDVYEYFPNTGPYFHPLSTLLSFANFFQTKPLSFSAFLPVL